MSDAEKEKLKQEINALNENVKILKDKARNSAESLRRMADYLDEVSRNCKTASAIGSTSSIVGCLCTIAGVYFTPITAVAVSPFLMVGKALGLTGALVNLFARKIEVEANSSPIQEADAALQNISQHVDEVRRQIRKLKDNKDKLQLLAVVKLAEDMYGLSNLTVHLIKCCMESKLLPNVMSECVLKVMRECGVKFGVTTATRQVVEGGSKSGVRRAVEAVAERAEIIMGVSVVFLVFNSIELHFTLQDIINEKGSYASELLRGKADELEAFWRG